MILEPQTLENEIARCMARDRHPLRQRLRALQAGAKRRAAPDPRAEYFERLLQRSRAVYDRRLANLPKPTFAADLPVVQKRHDIARAISENQAVVICGETGSGKTTQLPKICLDLGRGVSGLIGHTQPRRIAARAVATRLSQELESPLGQVVGYKVRFSDKLSEHAYIKLMTDGILLAETQSDRFLDRYDTIIIDEAHERSLNIDFLLGYLKQLLPKRSDLKLIITSATIDPQRFSAHFGNAPIVEVSGRTYPVETRYFPTPVSDPGAPGEDPDPVDHILSALDELSKEQKGDTLIFLTGEREIRETAEALRKHHPKNIEILPLYARLSADEQMRIFQPHTNPRIILATNVAETSLTVPGIKYVIDPGLARMSRYTSRTKVQRLPIEKISRASADQRKGRCGRVNDGVCIRLFSEDEFNARPQFTEPEILRTNLASVILQMKSLRLGDIQEFPFIDPPDYRMIRDGFATLHELGAIDERNELTPLGRDLARLPLDPRIGRMVLEAHYEKCLPQVLVIAAALSIQDPRERPLDKQEQADEAHARFDDSRSDFPGFLKLWSAWHDAANELSTSKLRAWCRANFLSFVRLREWDDVHQQVRSIAHEVFSLHVDHRRRFPLLELAPRVIDAIHRSLLAGLIGNIGYRSDAFEYTGARNTKFNIFPGSAMFAQKPAWLMAAELVETTKLYARTVAPIKPQWIERLGAHLVNRTYTDARWHMASAQVLAHEKVTLFGITLVARRSVHFGPIDPVASREIFVTEALVNGHFKSDADFFVHNRRLIGEIRDIEAKLRRRDLLVEPAKMFEFFNSRLGPNVYSGETLDKWRRHVERGRPTILFLTRRHLMRYETDAPLAAFPGEIRGFPLNYVFDAADPADGVTATIPLAALNQLDAKPFESLVPGRLREKVIALIKALPKSLRVKFVPVPETADKVFSALRIGEDSLLDHVAHELGNLAGEFIDRDAFDLAQLPPHLRMNFKIVDQDGTTVKTGRDLEAIRREFGMKARETFATSGPGSDFHRDGITSWDFDDLPASVEVRRNGVTLQGYPALIDAGMSVSMRLFDTEASAREANRGGVRRLLTLQLREETKWLSRKLVDIEEMCLNYSTIGSCDELKADLVTAIADRALSDAADVRTREQFVDRAGEAWKKLSEAGNDLAALVHDILAKFQAVSVEIAKPKAPMLQSSIADMEEDLRDLVYNGFIVETPAKWLEHYPRYLQAIEVRQRKLLNAGLTRDQAASARIAPLWEQYFARRAANRADKIVDPELEQYRWMLQELRVSLFAQELGTVIPISAKRLDAQWTKVQRS